MNNKSIWKNPVFSVSAAIIFALVLLGAIMPGRFGAVSSRLFEFTTRDFGWLYLLGVFAIILFLIWLAISKYGAIRLGGEKEKPEFPFFTWIGMLFSAGFGVGLVFWGVAEPMSHFFTPPFSGVQGESVEAARIAMGYAFFHWGVSQWAVLALAGLVIGFLQFRKQKNGLMSTALEPVLGSKPAVKNTVDTLAVIATVMGVATSLGLGALQMNGGLKAVFGLGQSIAVQLGIIAIIFVGYMLSSTTGLDKGIRYLSNLNLGLALVLLVFVFATGPTVFILETFTLALGDYFSNFIGYSLRMQPYQGGTWVRDWTIFYWAWAIAWSPFVGAFIARVSKGRTIREYIMGVMIIPPVIACLWIAVFGGTALWSDLNHGSGIASAVNEDVTVALFQTLNQLPFSTFMSVLSILLIFVFLVTSADSATYILSSMTTFGSLNPPQFAKFVWGGLMAVIAGVLLYAGGLEALQTASLIAALPFTILLLLLMVAVVRLVRQEPLPIRKADLKRFRRLEKAANEERRK
ncbi:MAG: BCCT family transporter [Paenibacillus macerans]|uniref:Transporter, betaine/carnitine/choline transporter family protein n=1 Tax=Paenibacillus macerans TaxID=44252 RepID=A0A090Y7C2_PAEMA|nr:BCCT family transporter [Paenibacillus macerans]KFM94648.1 transporter, betaine/carnitine/choline transporter family protein [Paenibacillus macerans]MCY7557235.1 BCCT family transporter [Paenibacillus macerans]MDU7471843.1 BCCT family transporter [Paenibacillus macerans]MEC0151787.1 BCCT family transporter [Paenibacillus macerans]MEC0329888.1 BCCT family transporter [Paenibacillus macerans]